MNATQQTTNQHVEVRIRTVEDDPADSLYLCHSSVADLDDLIAQMKRWGVEVPSGNSYADLTGQFAIEASAAFFEVIVNTTGESD